MTDLSTLNEQQREAVVSDRRRILVLAGAGSGKTKTLIQKILFLISEKGVKPSNILAITFTKNAANEMLDRLILADGNQQDYEAILSDKRITKQEKDNVRLQRKAQIPWVNKLTVRTFHSLCFTILKSSLSPDVFDSGFRLITDELPDDDLPNHANVAPERPFEIMEKVLRELCMNVNYLLKLKRYVLDYLVDRLHIDKVSPKSPPNTKIYTTLRGDKVKSKSERDIADWLYRHRIEYEYERPITIKDFSFKPDFYLPQANLYLEHISDKSYPTREKEAQFKKAGILCECTYEHFMNDTDRFNKEMERIIRGKIDRALDATITLNFEEEFKGYLDKIKEFIQIAIRCRDLSKLEGVQTEELKLKSSNSQHERIRLFYELALPLINRYQAYLVDKSYLEFDDLIGRTIQLLEQKPEVQEQYIQQFQFVLVDEFQDVNNSQVKLLKLLIRPQTQLFCVGDDWQSIYGFRGSEVKYIVNFDAHFPNSQCIKLSVNYRSTETIVGASNEVIKHNKHQVPKEVTSFKKTPTSIQIYRAKERNSDGVAYLLEKVQYFQNQGFAHEDILILYRRTSMYTPYWEALKKAGIKVSAKTIHASKGLEASVVFIIGLTDGSGGFPDVWSTDSLLKVIKEVKNEMLLEEERRLFYVALTRAKDEVILITEMGNESRFIDEIPKTFYVARGGSFKSVIEPIPLCENCGTERKQQYNYCPTCGVPLT